MESGRQSLSLTQDNELYSEFQSVQEFGGRMDQQAYNGSRPSREISFEAMRYSLMAGGKRLRPVLSLAVCDMLEGNREDVMPFACAIEMIHAYSLIHDDLPCMDNDDFRRGKPTNHKVFGEAKAILAGDALLNTACEIMLDAVLADDKDTLGKAAAARIIMDAAGSAGMIAGQIIDLESEDAPISFEELCRMHSLKTGALIRASILSAARLCRADEKPGRLLIAMGSI